MKNKYFKMMNGFLKNYRIFSIWKFSSSDIIGSMDFLDNYYAGFTVQAFDLRL
jgi:hypothetical protein